MLDKANLKDPGADPAIWEKVVRKLGVGAMPPQNSPTPGAADTKSIPRRVGDKPGQCRSQTE